MWPRKTWLLCKCDYRTERYRTKWSLCASESHRLHNKECMCCMRTLTMYDTGKRDYQESLITRQTDTEQSDPYVLLWFARDTIHELIRMRFSLTCNEYRILASQRLPLDLISDSWSKLFWHMGIPHTTFLPLANCFWRIIFVLFWYLCRRSKQNSNFCKFM